MSVLMGPENSFPSISVSINAPPEKAIFRTEGPSQLSDHFPREFSRFWGICLTTDSPSWNYLGQTFLS